MPEADSQAADVAAGSSPADGAAPQGGESSTPAASPGADTGKPEGGAEPPSRPKSSFEAVKALFKEGQATPDKPAAKPGEEPAKPEGEATKPEGEQAPTEGKQPPHKDANTRIRELVGERKTLEGKLKAAEGDVAAMGDLRQWAQSAGVTKEELWQGLGLIADVKRNPFEALPKLKALVADIEKQVGAAGDLPRDLAEDIERGAITEQRAREIAEARKHREFVRQNEGEREEQQAHERRVQGLKEQGDRCTQAVQGWEGQWKGSDPDYELKKDAVMDRIVFLIQTQGLPQTPEAAIAQAVQARKDVEDRMAKIRPSKPARQPVNGGDAGRATAQPKSSLEAARMAAAGQTPQYTNSGQ